MSSRLYFVGGDLGRDGQGGFGALREGTHDLTERVKQPIKGRELVIARDVWLVECRLVIDGELDGVTVQSFKVDEREQFVSVPADIAAAAFSSMMTAVRLAIDAPKEKITLRLRCERAAALRAFVELSKN